MLLVFNHECDLAKIHLNFITEQLTFRDSSQTVPVMKWQVYLIELISWKIIFQNLTPS